MSDAEHLNGIPLPQLPPLPFELTLVGKYENDIGNEILSKTSLSTISLKDECAENVTATCYTSLPIVKSTGYHRARSWFTRWFLEWWMLEILSWGLGLVCMVIIAIVLAKYDGKPDPRWRIGLSIGSFISIFSGFAKSALLLPTAEGK